jgi:hypothetical protein
MREAWAVTGAIGAPARMSGEMPAGAAQIVSVGEVLYQSTSGKRVGAYCPEY